MSTRRLRCAALLVVCALLCGMIDPASAQDTKPDEGKAPTQPRPSQGETPPPRKPQSPAAPVSGPGGPAPAQPPDSARNDPAPVIPMPNEVAPVDAPTEEEYQGELPEAEEVIEVRPTDDVDPVSESADEVVTVTGSRISASKVQQASHVTVVTSQDIARSGATTVDEVLRKLPTVSLQGINKNDNNAGEGLATIDLRNLGSSRTLVLVNGRRMVGTGSGAGEVVDLNSIPIALIERVDVLLEGASVIYGSDAVGGVINIVLKDDFDGMRADLQGGVSGHGDAEEVGGGVTIGKNFDRGNATLSLQGLVRRPVWQKDRSWARDTISDRGYNNEYNAKDGIYTIYGSSAVPAGRDGDYFFKKDPATGASFSPFDFENKDDSYLFSRRQYLAGSQERVQITLLADYELNRHARVFVEGMHTYRHSQTRLAPQPLIGGNSIYPNGFVVPVSNKFIPPDYLGTLPAGTEEIALVRRMNEVGDRVSDFSASVTRAVVGLAGEVQRYELDWELYVNVGMSRVTQTVSNSVNLARAIETADPEACAAAAEKGCVEGNYFGEGALDPAVVKYIRYKDIATAGYSQISSGASVSAKPVDLWAGELGLAGGVLYRRESGFNEPSPVTVAGESAGNGLDPTRGDFSAIELFAETGVPLLSKLPLAEDVSVDLAARFSRYDTFGSKTTFRTSGVYAPLKDIKFRGTWSTAFKNPTISDLYGGNADSYETVTDPCNNWDAPGVDPVVAKNCAAQGVAPGFNQNNVTGSQIRTNVGGNSKLKAETAQIWDVGVVLTPTFIPQEVGVFTGSLDYYRVSIERGMSNPQPQYLLDSCYNSPGLSADTCQYIGRGPDGSITRLQARLLNIGKISTAGWDVAANYQVGLGAVGLPSWSRLAVGFTGNRLSFYDETILGDKVRYADTITANSGTFTRWRWSLNQTLSGEHWSVTNTERYIGGAKYFNAPYGSIPDDWVTDIVYWDVSAQYQLDGLTIIGGVSNVLDKRPPFFLDGDTNSNGSSYDFIGRYFFTRLSYKM